MSKGELLRNIRAMSSGTIANLIGSTTYLVIDRAATTAVLYASALSEEECKRVETFADVCNLFLKANGK